MNSKQRVQAALEGRPVDRPPVTALYNFLVYADHFTELTGEPASQLQVWRHAPAVEHMRLYQRMVEAAPFELLQPLSWHSKVIPAEIPDSAPNETQIVHTKADIAEQVRIPKVTPGANDYINAAVAEFGRDNFLITGGVIGTVYSCSRYVGMTRLFELMMDDPGLIDALCERILEQNLAEIHRVATAGGDAIYIDDATATCDMISVECYERFSLPYMKAMVSEIHRLKHKAILIYFGGIADRLEQIASIGADGLSCETSMKGFVNDLGHIARQIGDRVTLFGNLDPVAVVQDASDVELECAIRQQIEAAKPARGFITCTGSPITPATSAARMRKFVELGRSQRY